MVDGIFSTLIDPSALNLSLIFCLNSANPLILSEDMLSGTYSAFNVVIFPEESLLNLFSIALVFVSSAAVFVTKPV